MTDIDRLSFKVLLPILLFRDIAQGRITEQFDPCFSFLCGCDDGVFFAVWIGASLFLKDKSMVGAFTQGAFRGSQAILGVAFVQNLYGNAGLVPLMIVASVPLYNIFFGAGADCHRAGRNRRTTADLVGKTLRGIITQPDHTGYFRGSAVLAPGNRLSADAGQGSVHAGQLRNAYGAAEHRRGL